MRTFLIVWLAAVFAGIVRAEDAPPAAVPVRELWIPRTQIHAALGAKPRAVLLTREQYEALRRDAQPPAAQNTEDAPVPVVLRSLTMKARAAGEIVIAEAELALDALSAEAAALPLHFEPAILASLTIDESGTLAKPEGDAKTPAVLLSPGRHVLKATLHYPVSVSAAGHSIAVRGIAAGASSFSLTLPAEERIESALTWSTVAAENGAATHTFFVPAGEKPYAITWSRRDIRDLAGTAVMQSCDYRYTLDAVRLHAELNLQFTARLAALPQSFKLPLPAEARVLSVEGGEVLAWEPLADKTGITINLRPGLDRHEASVMVLLYMDAKAEAGKARTLTLPVPQASGVHRASGRFSIYSEGDLRVRRVTAPPLSVQATSTTPQPGLAGVWDFAAITTAPQVETEELKPVFHATQDAQVELRRDGVQITRHLGIVPRQGRLFQVLLTLPAGEEITSLTNKDGSAADWRKVDGAQVEVRFPAGLKAGQTPALLLTTRLDPPQWSTLPEAGVDVAISRAGMAGADKLSGFIAVNVEDRFAVSTGTATGLEARDAATLGDDVPVRGSLVWFAPGDFRLPLHVSPRAAEFDAHVAAFALPMRHGVEIEGSLDLDIRQSGLRQVTVTLPAGVAPLWRCDSPLLSSTQLNKERGEWLLTFRGEARGRQALRWHLLLPVQADEKASQFTADLPVLRVPAARRSTVHWVMEANTDTELTFAATGLDERDTLTLPAVEGYTPRHRVIAAWAARGSDWKLGLTARRHQAAPLPLLVVDRYQLTTSVSADGTLRHQALLTVRANGQSFLDLPLPAGAQILSLLVNGTLQKPAASGTAALRAALPAGNTSAITVSLTWGASGASWNGAGEQKIEPLVFPESIPVVESHWILQLPEGFVYSDFRGDLERVNGPEPAQMRLFTITKSSDIAAAPEFVRGGGGGVSGESIGTKPREVKFQILQSSAPDLFGQVTNDTRLTMSGNWLETQFKTITSQDTMLRVVKKMKLDDAWNMEPAAAAERLASMTEVEQDRGTEIVTVRVSTSDSNESSELARAIVEAYEERRTDLEVERFRRMGQTVEGQIKSQSDLVEKNRLEMIDLQKKHNINDTVPYSTGQGFSPVIQPGLNQAEQARMYETRLEEDVMKMTTQLRTLQGLKGDQLIAGASELGVTNSTIQKLYPEYQTQVSNRASLLKSGFAKDHPKIKALDESIDTAYKQLTQASELFQKNLEVQIESSQTMLANAKSRTVNKTKDSGAERQNQSEYAAAKQKYESSMMLLNTIRDLSARQKVDEGVVKKPVEILSAPPVAVTQKAIAGLLPMEVSLPEGGAEFHFRGYHAPGAMTFSVRTLREESRVAWLWIAVGLAAAGMFARQRTVWRGTLVALLLWLGPWIAGAGLSVCHRMLGGWLIGCVLVICWRAAGKVRGVPAAALLLLCLLPLGNAKADVLVPYDPAKPLAGQQPTQVYMDYEQFQKLWQQARDNRLANNAPALPPLAGAEAAVLSALYEMSVAGSALKTEAVLTLHTSGDWAVLDLREKEGSAPFAGANVVSLLLDGKPAVLHEGLLLVEKPGRHVLRASLQAALARDWRAFSLSLPPSAASLLSLAHRDPSLRLRLNGGLPMEVNETKAPAYTWRGTAALGTARRLELQRLPAVTLAAGSDKPALGAVSARLLVTPALERLDCRIDYAFAGAERRDFSFAFDANLTPVQIAIANLESWSVKDVEGKRVLDFRLSVPARDGLTARFTAERAAAAKPGEEHQAPAVVPVANRQEYTVEILSSDELEITPAADGGWARSELQGMGSAEETGFRKVGAWRLAGAWSPLKWTASARALHRRVKADYAYKIAGGMLETTVTMELRAGEHEDLSSLAIPLPPGAALQTLNGQRLRDWWREGDRLELRFTGATAATTTVWLDFTQPLSAELMKNGAPLPALTLPGFTDASGSAVIVTGPELDVRLRLDDPPAEVREAEAETARGDYRFLPPLVLRRGFTYKTSTFHVTALLEPVTPRFAARWVLGAAVQDTWTEAQFRVDLEISQGALPEAVFQLPAGMPEASVNGPVVRETVRKVLPDGRAEYHVIFQSPVTAATGLTVALELPHTGRLVLPDITWPGATLTERYLIMQNFSGGEIVPDMTASSGVEPLSREMMQELHFTVKGFSNPLSWRLGENWKLAVDHRTLETTSGPEAVVLYAELTTMLRAEGPEWLRAVYHLHNRALQFLPLRLPEGTELISATVAGSPVRADAGTLADGKPGLLIPLIQTRPGDLAMDVEIVCRAKAAGKGDRRLDDPDIPGISIQRTLWNVWTPPGWELTDADGNMEQVEEKKTFFDKLETGLSELDKLTDEFTLSSRSSARKRNAWSQSNVLIEDLETKLDAREKNLSYGNERDGEELRVARQRLNAAKEAQKGISFADEATVRGATGSFAGSDKWVWDYNSTYLQKRSLEAAEAGDKAEALQYSVPLLNAGVGNANEAVRGGNARGPVKSDMAGADREVARNYNTQIATLNGATLLPQAEEGKKGKEADDGAAVVAAQQQELGQTLFNNVRAPQRRAMPATPAPVTATAGFVVPAPVAAPANADTPAPATEPAQSTIAAEGTTIVVHALMAPPPPPVKPAGRVSIPVTFPLDGEVHRFRKVNDGAALRLTMKPVSRSTSSRGLATGLLAGGLGVLWLVNRATRKKVSGKRHQQTHRRAGMA